MESVAAKKGSSDRRVNAINVIASTQTLAYCALEGACASVMASVSAMLSQSLRNDLVGPWGSVSVRQILRTAGIPTTEL